MRRRIGAIVVAAGAIVAGVVAPLCALGAFRNRTERVAATTATPTRPLGFYVLFPDEPLGWDEKGRAIIDPETNLPDGTIVDLYWFSADLESPGQGTVNHGRIPISVAN